MNKEELYSAITHIDEELLDLSKNESCDTVFRKDKVNNMSRKMKIFVPIAACLAVAIISVVALSMNSEHINPVVFTSESSATTQNNDEKITDNNNSNVSNGIFLPEGETYENNTFILIDKADSVQPKADHLLGEVGKWCVSPGISETVINHKNENVLYRIKIEICEFSDNNEISIVEDDKEKLVKEAERLFKACNEKGFDNCAFEVSDVTYYVDGEQQTFYKLYANICDTAFFDEFPASTDYGYWLMFINEFV